MIIRWIRSRGKDLGEVGKRFPVSLLIIVAGVITWISWIATEGDETVYLPIILVLYLGLVFSTAWHLTLAYNVFRKPLPIIGWILLITGLGGYYFYIRNLFEIEPVTYCLAYQYPGLVVLGILGIAVAPFWKKRGNNSFLVFNRQLFVSYLLTAGYALVLLIGLSLAIVAINQLIEGAISDKIYGYLAVLFLGLFFGVYFLAQVPSPEEELNPSPGTGWKILGQYILLPISVVYGLIIFLYAAFYFAKDQSFETWTEDLIWWFYVVGFLTILINLSIRSKADRRQTFMKWVVWVIFPIGIGVLGSIGHSIFTEGLSELKYYIATSSIYLLGICGYLAYSKDPDYRWIIWPLAILTLIATIGPLNACQSSVRNQKKWVTKTLKEQGWKGQVDQISFDDADHQELFSRRLLFLKQRKDTTIVVDGNAFRVNQYLSESWVDTPTPGREIYLNPKLNGISLEKYNYLIPIVDFLEGKEENFVFVDYQKQQLTVFRNRIQSGQPIDILDLKDEFIRLGEDRIIHLGELDLFIETASYKIEKEKIEILFLKGFALFLRN